MVEVVSTLSWGRGPGGGRQMEGGQTCGRRLGVFVGSSVARGAHVLCDVSVFCFASFKCILVPSSLYPISSVSPLSSLRRQPE